LDLKEVLASDDSEEQCSDFVEDISGLPKVKSFKERLYVKDNTFLDEFQHIKLPKVFQDAATEAEDLEIRSGQSGAFGRDSQRFEPF
jgi:hypothetical protein